MGDRSSRPHHCPHRTRSHWSARPCTCGGSIGSARSRSPTGPAWPSTVYQVLVRCRLSRLTAIDRVTGESVRRYEHPYPGSLVHVDVKELGNVPGGGWRFTGRAQGKRNRTVTAHRTGQRNGTFPVR